MVALTVPVVGLAGTRAEVVPTMKDRKGKTGRYTNRDRAEATTRREAAARRRGSGTGAAGIRRNPSPGTTSPASGVYRGVDEDPLFQVVTADGRHWIDPFSGEAVPVVGTVAKTVQARLAQDPSWRTREPLSHGELQISRWRQQLAGSIPGDDRLRLFSTSGRGWLNPFSGRFHPEVERSDGLITPRTVQAMARALATDPLAQRGVMRSREELLLALRGEAARESQRKTATGLLEVGEHDAREPAPSQKANDLSRARDVQTQLQGKLPRVQGYDLGVHFAPQHEVSGDFYAAIPLPEERCLFFVGDVTGHGMQAALVAATALKALRLLVAQSYRGDLVDLLCLLNENVKHDLMPGQFITLFAAELDRQRHAVDVVLAGTPPAGGANLRELRVRPLGRKGAAIGILPSATLRRVLSTESVALACGDVLVQYTDGVTEANNATGEEFGLHRFLGAAFSHAAGSMQALTDGVAGACSAFEGPTAADDVTVFALKRLAEGATPLAK
jgi:serine phosphatase RsbU (regulator of sigma subunit)